MNTQTVAGTPSQHRRLSTWRVITPAGIEGDTEHRKWAHVVAELMDYEDVNEEVIKELNAEFNFSMTEEDVNSWVFNNCADIARSLGYQIIKKMS